MKRMYYHVIEDGGYGNIASHGWYRTESDAQKEADRLSDFFPDLSFYVHPSPSTKEPEFITV
jgi:hypothetical protein